MNIRMNAIEPSYRFNYLVVSGTQVVGIFQSDTKVYTGDIVSLHGKKYIINGNSNKFHQMDHEPMEILKTSMALYENN